VSGYKAAKVVRVEFAAKTASNSTRCKLLQQPSERLVVGTANRSCVEIHYSAVVALLAKAVA
jgi:hypothetical protein